MFQALSTLATTLLAQAGEAEAGGAVMFFYVVLFVLIVVGMWKVFEKAGQPGWAALIPFYNAYVMLQIVGRPGWWLILYFVPLINIVVAIVVCIELAQSFGKGIGFALGLIFLGFIFVLILGFGSAKYIGPAAKAA